MEEADTMQDRKVFLNKHTNLLELEEHMFPLVDVDTPNVFRNLFHYDEIPKIAFNDRIVPHNMPDEIWITDTTFRDGQQSRAPYTTEQIVTIYDHLHRLGGPNGKIRQSEFFLYSKKDRDAVYKCLEKGYQFPEVTSWIRASKKDFQLVKDIGLKETGILVSCSDYHIFYKLKMTRKQALELLSSSPYSKSRSRPMSRQSGRRTRSSSSIHQLRDFSKSHQEITISIAI